MQKTKNLGLELPDPSDVVDVTVLTRNFAKLDDQVSVTKTESFNFDALVEQLPDASLSVKRSGTDAQPVYTETITRNGKTIATRKTTQLTDGSVVVNVTSEEYGINSSKKYSQLSDDNYTGVPS